MLCEESSQGREGETNVLRKLEEMMTQVDYLRAGCHQIFQGFVNLSRSPSGTDNGGYDSLSTTYLFLRK